MTGHDIAYLDYAATSPMLPEVVRAMDEAQRRWWANPNSLHGPGREAFRALEAARSSIAASLGCHGASQIVLTSGGTEADNMAVAGIVERAQASAPGHAVHVVVSAFEHPAVLSTARHLESRGVQVTYLAPRPDGYVWPEDLEASMRPETVLVSVMAANNEVGTVQPVDALAEVAHRHGALFHADCVQLAGKLPLALEASGVDAASVSAHKLGGPHGTGVLYLRRSTSCTPLLHGGGQEGGLRSGTQDVAGAIGMAVALESATAHVREEAARERELSAELGRRLVGLGPRVRAATDPDAPGPADAVGRPLAGCGVRVSPHLPGIVTVTVDGIDGQTLLMRLDEAGVAASGGSACSSRSLEPSHVLAALGIPRDRALGELRFSLGRDTTQEDVDRAVAAVAAALAG